MKTTLQERKIAMTDEDWQYLESLALRQNSKLNKNSRGAHELGAALINCWRTPMEEQGKPKLVRLALEWQNAGSDKMQPLLTRLLQLKTEKSYEQVWYDLAVRQLELEVPERRLKRGVFFAPRVQR